MQVFQDESYRVSHFYAEILLGQSLLTKCFFQHCSYCADTVCVIIAISMDVMFADASSVEFKM